MSPPLPLRFVLSAAKHTQLPDNRAEVAFVGRSNVGKSSLVNALAGRKALAKVSGTPGRTQLLNCYALDEDTALIDCPGYGYAKAPGAARTAWQRNVQTYLSQREALAEVYVLVDGMIGPTKLDLEMLAWLVGEDLPIRIVATKHDRVKPSQRTRRERDLAEGCGVLPEMVLWVSATKGTGIPRLRDTIRASLAA